MKLDSCTFREKETQSPLVHSEGYHGDSIPNKNLVNWVFQK